MLEQVHQVISKKTEAVDVCKGPDDVRACVAIQDHVLSDILSIADDGTVLGNNTPLDDKPEKSSLQGKISGEAKLQ